MKETKLGKIYSVEFGSVKDYPFLMGLQMTFKLEDGFFIGNGVHGTVNISSSCNWGEKNRSDEITKIIETLHKILDDAKVNYVSELLGKPVEVTIDNGVFVGFRILTEVI